VSGIDPATFRDAQLVAGVRADGVMRHQQVGDLLGERRSQPATDIDRAGLLHNE